MKILLSVEHPAWVHQFKYIIKELTEKGHEVKVLAIRKDVTIDLLNAYSIPYEIISESSGNNTFEKGLIFLSTTWKMFLISRKFHPDLFLGRSSPMMAINAFIFRKPHVLFEDSEPSKFCLNICKLCSEIIVTPSNFTLDLGKKQIRVSGFKELFYLHPDLFTPNPDILKECGLSQGDRYAVVRFVSWKAHHDIGQHGIRDKIGLLRDLSEKIKVVIVSEGELPDELKQYQMSAPPADYHDILAYASLFVSDAQTSTTEAAMLGIPAIRCNTFVGNDDMGVFPELENKYSLIYNVSKEEDILPLVDKLLQNSHLKQEWQWKREVMLSEKVNMTQYMMKLLEEKYGV